MAMMISLLTALFPVIFVNCEVGKWPGSYWDIPGEYCQSAYPYKQCCQGREDNCGLEILNTICYCDTFCNRTVNSDCCPDYFTHCEGLSPPSEPESGYQYQSGVAPETILRPDNCEYGYVDVSDPRCEYKGQVVGEGKVVRENCNECRCETSSTRPGCMEMMCSTHQCIIDVASYQDLEAGARSGLYQWRPGNTSALWGHRLQEAAGLLGTGQPQWSRIMSPVQFSYNPASLPAQFQSSDHWPGLISPVMDQGWCGASWSHSAASVLSDRTSISRGRQVTLSSDGLLHCPHGGRGQLGCVSGTVDTAWDMLRRYGTWDSGTCVDTCGAEATCHVYRSQPAYRVGRADSRMEDIMHEIFTQGPVQAVMEVYTDLLMYGGGVYSLSNLGQGRLVGHHGVRIVGWGETEDGTRYWTVANSWGLDWGERGHFRIRRGEDECRIESFVFAAWPGVERPRQARTRSGGSRHQHRKQRRHRHHRHRQYQHRGERRGHGGRKHNKKYFQVG